jgi:hypothetical protein
MTDLDTYWINTHDLDPLPSDYESWSAAQKQSFLWNERILKTQYDVLPPFQKIDILGLLFTAFSTKLDFASDEAPPNWKKAIHAHGTVAQVKFRAVPDSPFTGLFKGADYGFVRLSVTGDPAHRGFAPGLALKLLIDGQPSENVSALFSLTGQGDNYNFFTHEMSNIVAAENEWGPRFLNFVFRRGSGFPRKLYLQGFGHLDQQGVKEGSPAFPYRIYFVPNSNLHFDETPPHDFREDMGTLPTGTSLYDVFAVPSDEAGDDNAVQMVDLIEQPAYRQQAILIGTLEMASPFVASFYGDSRLFFKHQRFANR